MSMDWIPHKQKDELQEKLDKSIDDYFAEVGKILGTLKVAWKDPKEHPLPINKPVLAWIVGGEYKIVNRQQVISLVGIYHWSEDIYDGINGVLGVGSILYWIELPEPPGT